jgi:hypothetical protein
MRTFSSLAAVMGLWLAVSFLLWAFYRLFRQSGGAKRMQLLDDAAGLIAEGAAVFAALRTRASERVTAEGYYRTGLAEPGEILKEDVRSLLNGIETQSGYFERVNALKKRIQKTFNVPDFLALSEILQIRRDFWAASEIFLMDGIQELGPELADTPALEKFQEEARALLFKDEPGLTIEPDSRDAIELRLAIAREEAMAFQQETERAIAAELEKSRFPTAAELAAVPWSLVKGLYTGLREVRYLLGDAGATARNIARAVTSKGLKAAAEELRKARADMPGQFATAFERAGGLARQGGEHLKRHYEFVIEAQELRARYAELLARAPDLSEKGKQFLARLELERRAEQFRETSGDLLDWGRQGLVAGIAYLIAGLQHVQAKVTPPSHKQLAPLPAGASIPLEPAAFASEPETPLRVLLLPASAYSGGNHGREEEPGRKARPKTPRGGSLLDRLSGIALEGDEVPPHPAASRPPSAAQARLGEPATSEAAISASGYGEGEGNTPLHTPPVDLGAVPCRTVPSPPPYPPADMATLKIASAPRRAGAGEGQDEGAFRAASGSAGVIKKPEAVKKSKNWRFPFGAQRK